MAVCRVTGGEPRAVGLDKVPFAQDAERAVDLAERACVLGLA
jgi:hypothetical protein